MGLEEPEAQRLGPCDGGHIGPEGTVRFTLRRWSRPRPTKCSWAVLGTEGRRVSGDICGPLDPGPAGHLAAVAERLPAVPLALALIPDFLRF